MKSTIFNSEEDIRVKIVIPWLESIGFNKDEFSCEASFKLHFGKGVVRIDTEKQIKQGSPRADILVKRNDENLFVIEVKKDTIDFTDDDIEQATSYACLARAPITVLTNGKDFEVFKTWNKEPIERTKQSILDKYPISPDLSDNYHDALETFLGI
ncbi:MAG: type I restriction enzyme HsdR N-terminal domain-containing protein, partial [Deltaproteobacteria bacterium]|nr:type I restriction enzyme HsdR N-terminal domain-containing protein [Deltaproteobacteria bacterium]